MTKQEIYDAIKEAIAPEVMSKEEAVEFVTDIIDELHSLLEERICR